MACRPLAWRSSWVLVGLQSQDYIGRYFTRYPGVQEYMDHTKAIAAEQGYVETIYGRRLYLPDIKASNAIARQAAERTAINAPMQGTAARHY